GRVKGLLGGSAAAVGSGHGAQGSPCLLAPLIQVHPRVSRRDQRLRGASIARPACGPDADAQLPPQLSIRAPELVPKPLDEPCAALLAGGGQNRHEFIAAGSAADVVAASGSFEEACHPPERLIARPVALLVVDLLEGV